MNGDISLEPPLKKQKIDKTVIKDKSITELQDDVNETFVNDNDTVVNDNTTVVNGNDTVLNDYNTVVNDNDIVVNDNDTVVVDDENNSSYKNEKVARKDKYYDHVAPEDLEKLREFKILDEVRSNDEDSNDEESDSSDGEKSDGLPEEEIEKMLDEGLPEGFKGAPKPKEKSFITRQKVVLEEKGINLFEVLPLDWMMVRHYSGMPIYMHRASRVCTLSKPYFLGKGNTRRHDIPISAIPCLAYRKALEEESKQKEIDRDIAEQIKTGTWKQNVRSQQNDGANEINDKTNKADSSENEKKCPFSHKTLDDANNARHSDIDKLNEDAAESNDVTDVGINKETKHIEERSDILNSADSREGPESSVAVDETSSQGVTVAETTDKPREELPLNRQPVVLPGGIVMPPPRVETVSDSWKTQHLTHDQLNDYCKALFKFKTVNIMHFKRWADRRKYTRARKTLQYPTLPEGTKLITIPAHAEPDGTGGKANKRDWVMNMNGRSYLSVFHEYVRRALQKQPVYEFKQLENASTPYQATVYIGGMQYGLGRGSSKRVAKANAARASIHILIPEMRSDLDQPRADHEPDFTFFDYVGIEDPRITEFCAATCEPSPHAILRTCLLRNFGAGDRHIHTEMKKLEYQKIELTMKVGKHTASVVCKNKKTAKQRASQAILQALHPHVRSWGSLLRLYGSRSVKSCKEKKLEEQQITLLQDAASHNQPNHAVLSKLRLEMLKLKQRDEAVVPIGTLLMTDELPTHSGSNLNNVDL